MDLQLTAKTALITGDRRGTGLAIVRAPPSRAGPASPGQQAEARPAPRRTSRPQAPVRAAHLKPDPQPAPAA
jgi:hypothetical protein